MKVQQDRIESLTRQIQDLEGKVQSSQLTVERLTLNLAKTEATENQQKDKVRIKLFIDL